MDTRASKVLVATVGLNEGQRALIDEHCRRLEGVELAHANAWTFGLLRARLLIVDMDSGVGKEALNMLDEFKESAGRGRPVVLRYTAGEFRATGWGGKLDAITGTRRAQEVEFCKGLRHALEGLGVAPAA